MPSRISLVSALAVAVPALVVLLAVLLLARPAAPAPAEPTGESGASSASSAAAGAAPTDQAVAPAGTTPLPTGPIAPELTGGGAWINSEPLKLAELKGKVVLVDFWTYGCYNCTNTLPYVKQWWSKYKDQGLVIIGVHTPEFESEKVLENVQQAVQRDQIGWPVVQDNDKQIWGAYGNHYWPRFYLVDHRGRIIYDHIGEGAYDETERQIVAALAAR